jgi:hypothetical protein
MQVKIVERRLDVIFTKKQGAKFENTAVRFVKSSVVL